MKFSIRDLFWLMLLAACCTLWWMDRVRLDRLQRQEAERTKQTTEMMQFLNASMLTPLVPPSPPPPGDKKIAETIVKKLWEEKGTGILKGFNLDVQVDEGTVIISGRVSTVEQQDRALDIARRAPGVKQVVNEITVTPKDGK